MNLPHVTVELQLLLAARGLLAAALGAIIGLEREMAGKHAGTRTHLLVALSSAFAVGCGALVVGAGDPTRILHGVITGVGFIGAGAIVQSKKHGGTVGLTTAATILLVAAVGAGCALGLEIAALLLVAIALVGLRGAHHIERLTARLQRSRSDDNDQAD